MDVGKEAKAVKQSRLAKAVLDKVEKNGSDRTLSAFLTQVDQLIDSSYKIKFSPDDVTRILSAYSQDVENSPANHHRITLAKRYIYSLYLKKIHIQKSIDDLAPEAKSIDRRAQFKTNILFSSIFVASFVEFLIGYYCIYEVDWLGWDLVEPVTYSIAQGKFVIATWFF